MANISKKKKANIIQELEKIVTSGNIVGITNEQLAQQFNTRRQTVAEYLKQIYAKIPPEDIKETEIKLKSMFDKIFRVSQNILQKAKNPVEQERALNLILKCMREYTDFLERFGLKAKAIENYNIQGEVQHKVVQVNIPVEVQQYLQE